jgi:hypothetical protein
VQISADCRVHLIPFHPDSSPRLYRPTPRHTTPSRAPRSPAARRRTPRMRSNRRTIDAIDPPARTGDKPRALADQAATPASSDQRRFSAHPWPCRSPLDAETPVYLCALTQSTFP